MSFSAAGSHDIVDPYGVVVARAAKPESFKEISTWPRVRKTSSMHTLSTFPKKNFDREMDGLSSMVGY